MALKTDESSIKLRDPNSYVQVEISESIQEETDHVKNVAPKPFLKRKSKAVKVEPAQDKKEVINGKSRIDCWHRDKETNVMIYGNKQKSKKSLLKKSPAAKKK